MDDVKARITTQIKAEALRLGFDACGLSPAAAVEEATAAPFRAWLAEGCQGEMHYLENFLEKRLDPRLLMEGAQTVLSVVLNYYPGQQLAEEGYQFAWYAYGKDYHEVVKGKLQQLLTFIRSLVPEAEGRAFCDTAPLLERYWAAQAGLGWIGKNNLLIRPQGSTFFLGELLLNIELTYDRPLPNRCGTCTRCIEACPTQALSPHHLEASRCLSYLTIEHRGALPEGTGKAMGTCIYGCDRCQGACPWNQRAVPTQEPLLQPSPEFLAMTPADWHTLSVEQYRALFKGSAVKRAKFEGLRRNIEEVERGTEEVEKKAEEVKRE
jgi:epoxyqueuosine reductase